MSGLKNLVLPRLIALFTYSPSKNSFIAVLLGQTNHCNFVIKKT